MPRCRTTWELGRYYRGDGRNSKRLVLVTRLLDLDYYELEEIG